MENYEYNSTYNNNTTYTTCECKPGVLLPIWEPNDAKIEMIILRAIIYFVCLIYCFIGVAIISDMFMAAIECITSKKRF